MSSMRLFVLALLAACAGDEVGGMTTSGPDSGLDPDAGIAEPDAPDAAPGNEDTSAVPPGCVSGRATSDRPDDSPLDQIRVLYVLPSDGADEHVDTSGKICNSIRGIATWFHVQSGSNLRFDTSGGDLDIGFVRLSKTDAQMRGTDTTNQSVDYGTGYVRERIERELVAMGQIKSNKLYGVYYGGTSVYACGGGAYPPTIKARVGAMYLKAIPPGMTITCQSAFPWGASSMKPAYIDYGLLHELVHSMGVVVSSAPHWISANPGHVFDTGVTAPNRDLMYSPRPGTNDPAWATNATDGLVLDIGHDDYFNAGQAVELSTLSLLTPVPASSVRVNGW